MLKVERVQLTFAAFDAVCASANGFVLAPGHEVVVACRRGSCRNRRRRCGRRLDRSRGAIHSTEASPRNRASEGLLVRFPD
jgi:hypothetical protein